MRQRGQLWGAQAASLHLPAACRRNSPRVCIANAHQMPSASCRWLQAGSLRSPSKTDAFTAMTAQ